MIKLSFSKLLRSSLYRRILNRICVRVIKTQNLNNNNNRKNSLAPRSSFSLFLYCCYFFRWFALFCCCGRDLHLTPNNTLIEIVYWYWFWYRRCWWCIREQEFKSWLKNIHAKNELQSMRTCWVLGGHLRKWLLFQLIFHWQCNFSKSDIFEQFSIRWKPCKALKFPWKND